MSLPREVREIIYCYTLIVPHRIFNGVDRSPRDIKEPEIILEPASWEQRRRRGGQQGLRRPAVALLRTSKAIHDEAIIVLYGQNRYRLPASTEVAENSIFKRYAPLLRHISIRFSVFDVPDLTPRQILSIWKAAIAERESGHRPNHKLCDIMMKTRKAWRKKKDLLVKLLNLRSIKFYIENNYLQHQSSRGYSYNTIRLTAEILHDCFASFLDPARPLGCAKLQFQLSVPNDKTSCDPEWRALGAKEEDWLAFGLNGISWEGDRRGPSRPKGFWDFHPRDYHRCEYGPLDFALASSAGLI